MELSSFGKALTSGLDIIEALEVTPGPLSFSELQNQVKVSAASFARFLKLLVDRGYVMRDESGKYQLGWRLAQAGQKVMADIPLRVLAANHLRQIVEETNESAESVLYVPDGFVFLQRVECDRSVVLRAQPGTLFRCNDTTAIGRLAICLGLVPGHAQCMAKEKDKIRRIGFAQMLQNNNEVYRGAAAVYNRSGVCIGCVVIGAPAFRVKAQNRKKFQDLLLDHAARISQKLGFTF